MSSQGIYTRFVATSKKGVSLFFGQESIEENEINSL